MSRFLLSLLLVAAVGSAVLWFGLPVLKSSLPGTYDSIASAVSGRAKAAEAAVVAGAKAIAENETAAKAAAGAKAAAAAAKKAAAQAAGSVAEAAGAVAETVSDAAQDLGLAGPGAGEDPAEAAPSGGDAAATDAAAAPVDEGPDPRAAKNADPGLPWGVVTTNSFCYDASLRRLGTIPGGTAIEQVSRKALPVGDLVQCKVLKDLVWQERTVWFFDSDLVCFDGATYAETDRASRDAVLDYCAAWGRYEKEKAANIARFRPANPHADAYRKAKEEHDALQKEISETMAKVRYSDQHDLPGGPAERAALLKKANDLRVKQKAEAARFAPVRDRWQAWEDEHDLDEASIPESPAMREASETMERLRPAVEKIVPGL